LFFFFNFKEINQNLKTKKRGNVLVQRQSPVMKPQRSAATKGL